MIRLSTGLEIAPFPGLAPLVGGSSIDPLCRPPRTPWLSAMSSSSVGILQALEFAGKLGLSLGELLRAPVVLQYSRPVYFFFCSFKVSPPTPRETRAGL